MQLTSEFRETIPDFGVRALGARKGHFGSFDQSQMSLGRGGSDCGGQLSRNGLAEDQSCERQRQQNSAIRSRQLDLPAKRHGTTAPKFLSHQVARTLAGFRTRTVQVRKLAAVRINQPLLVRYDVDEIPHAATSLSATTKPCCLGGT